MVVFQVNKQWRRVCLNVLVCPVEQSVHLAVCLALSPSTSH